MQLYDQTWSGGAVTGQETKGEISCLTVGLGNANCYKGDKTSVEHPAIKNNYDVL